jgi:hypothetical protein
VLFFSLLVFASACSSTRSVQGDNETVLESDRDSDTDPADVVIDSDPVEEPDTLKNPIEIDASARYKVGMILPFSLDQRSLHALVQSDKRKRNRPLVALGFYEGALLALDSLESMGGHFDIVVRDSRNQSSQVSRLLSSPELRRVDLLFGPVLDATMLEASTWSAEQERWSVSPFRALPDGMENGFHIAMEPSLEERCQNLAKAIRDWHRFSKVIVLYRENSTDTSLALSCLDMLKGAGDTIIDFPSDFKLQGLESLLSLAQENVILVPSKNEVFVRAVSSRLSGLSKDYPIQLYGLAEWLRYESLSPSALNNTHFRYARSYLPQSEDSAFYRMYKEAYFSPPTDFAYRGYDMMMYFGKLLMLYGPDFHEYMEQHRQFDGMHDAFLFRLDDSSSIYRNEQLHILEYMDYHFQQVEELE